MAASDRTVLIYGSLFENLAQNGKRIIVFSLQRNPCVFNDPLSGAALLFFFVCIFSLFFLGGGVLILISTMPLQGPSGWAEAGEPTAARETLCSLQNLQLG